MTSGGRGKHSRQREQGLTVQDMRERLSAFTDLQSSVLRGWRAGCDREKGRNGEVAGGGQNGELRKHLRSVTITRELRGGEKGTRMVTEGKEKREGI